MSKIYFESFREDKCEILKGSHAGLKEASIKWFYWASSGSIVNSLPQNQNVVLFALNHRNGNTSYVQVEGN